MKVYDSLISSINNNKGNMFFLSWKLLVWNIFVQHTAWHIKIWKQNCSCHHIAYNSSRTFRKNPTAYVILKNLLKFAMVTTPPYVIFQNKVILRNWCKTVASVVWQLYNCLIFLEEKSMTYRTSVEARDRTMGNSFNIKTLFVVHSIVFSNDHSLWILSVVMREPELTKSRLH